MVAKKIYSKFDLYYITLYFSLFLVWTNSWATQEYLYIYFASSVLLYIFTTNLFIINPIEGKFKKIELGQSENDIIIKLCILSFISILTYLILAGVPLFSEDPASNKLQVSKYPILVRFYRITGLVPVIIGILSDNKQIKKILQLYCASMVILGFLTAFKGYAIPYLASYLILKYRGMNIRYAITIMTAVILSLYYLSVAADVEVSVALAFLYERITDLQLLGTSVLIENYRSIEYYPIFSEIILPFQKLIYSDPMSLQQSLYQIYHVFDENKLELANFYLAEIFLYYGLFWSIVFVSFQLVIVAFVLPKFIRTRLGLSIIITTNILVIDGLMNGKLIFRMIDAFAFVLIPILLIKILKRISLMKNFFVNH